MCMCVSLSLSSSPKKSKMLASSFSILWPNLLKVVVLRYNVLVRVPMEMRGEPDPQTESVISQTNRFSADLDDCSLLSGLAAVVGC